jgi:hypothetical protein
MTLSRIRVVGLLGFVALAFVACAAPGGEESESGTGAISSEKTERKDAGSEAGASEAGSKDGGDDALDCAKGGDEVCRDADAVVNPKTGKAERPLCYYLANKKVYRCTTQAVDDDNDPRRAFFGAQNGKVPGSGVLCSTDETTCEDLDPRLHCDEDPAVTAKAGYPSGTCFGN